MTSKLMQPVQRDYQKKYYKLIGKATVGIILCSWNYRDRTIRIRTLNSIACDLLSLSQEKSVGGLLKDEAGEELATIGQRSMLHNLRVEEILSFGKGQGGAIELRVTSYPVAADELAFILVGECGAPDRDSSNYKYLDEWGKTFDAIEDLVTIQDMQMRIIRANRAAHETFGLAVGDLVGEKCYLAFQDSPVPCENCPVTMTASDCGGHRNLIHNSKVQKTFDVRSSPITDDDGEMRWIVHIARDVTRESALERQLQQALKMEAIGTLAGGIAHDFNNILSAIIGYGYIVKGKLDKKSPLQGDIEQILSGADRAVDLVKQILTFARQESHEQLNPLRIQYIVKEVMKLMRSSLPATIELKQQIDNSCRPILADPGQMHQLVMNLCTNGKQAIGADHGTLSVTLREVTANELQTIPGLEATVEGDYVCLDVLDTGCGMDQQMMERIFDPFFTTRIKEHGTGLGLAVVHGIVKKHDGLIAVESEVNVGSVLHVAFPVTKQGVVAEIAEQHEVLTGTERIMVVDDEPALGSVIRNILERLGYKVEVYTESLAAVRHFREDPDCCDLVLTDMTMPDMTGSELAREVLSLRPGLPVIMLTGFSEVIDREKALQIGIREFLLKPVKKKVLAKVIREVLSSGANPYS
ncbi:PAS domain-containing sensor histidine kinase [Desulfopila sp. IMCC35008]|uniref:hybrid sensor histidine kinase/response regulator n=1 Tax=Desulfopila sp. IMCC35008 TaxID=2653858 RepID=UPI0013D09C23|nr:PAS domain-containing sensor histidine kinase [Desulfopila sp. IMCC35008]